MGVIYTRYAEDTIQDRKISKGFIEDALRHPDQEIAGKKGRTIAHKIMGSKLLRVVYEIEGKDYIVVTAYFTHPERYLRQ
ncbi:DUF4258 domain-containing protein [Candidatus Woesearchaeota archaeon]|nr:DUF4258 domain-containing protein [Candidatus Woesearchaeota archaeon]